MFCAAAALSLGQTRVHAHSPAFACRRADPILKGRAWGASVILETFVCVPETGEWGRPSTKESKGGRQGREGSLLHALLKVVRSRLLRAARWLVCNLRDNVHWLYSLNCWRTDMTSDCCFYMFLLIGTKGKCTWLFFLVLNIAKQIADKLQ